MSLCNYRGYLFCSVRTAIISLIWDSDIITLYPLPSPLSSDVVIIEKIDGKYEKLKKGQIIAFQYGGVIVVHRLINIIEDEGQYYFYTKGDANNSADEDMVKEEEVLGIVRRVVKYIGYPTVLINELFGR